MMLKDRDYTRETRQVEENDGLDRYIGYIPELLQHVKRVFEEDMRMEFKYRIELVSEGYYGKRNPNTGEWDGLVKELQDSVSGSKIIPKNVFYLCWISQRIKTYPELRPVTNPNLGLALNC